MKHLYVALLLFFCLHVAAQEPIATDRPGQSNTPAIVPSGKFQAETGVRHTQAEPRHPQWQLPTTLLKYGINDNFEIRANAQYAYNISPDSTNSGIKPLFVGIKAKLADEHGWLPQTSVLVQVQLPDAASKVFKIPDMAPEVVLAMQNSVGKIKLQYNAGVAWDGETTAPSYLYTLQPSVELTEKWNAFVETYAYFPQHAHPDHWVDGGFTFLITNNMQLDISGGYELTAHNHYHSYFESVGFSFRI